MHIEPHKPHAEGISDRFTEMRMRYVFYTLLLLQIRRSRVDPYVHRPYFHFPLKAIRRKTKIDMKLDGPKSDFTLTPVIGVGTRWPVGDWKG